MIAEKEVSVRLISTTIKYYESLGYEIYRRKDCNGIMRVPNDYKILIKVEDLPRSSQVKVTRICDLCGDRKLVQFKSLETYASTTVTHCFKCSSTLRKGALNCNYIHGNQHYSNYKRGAKSRNYEFKLSLDEFIKIVQRNCHYCNAKPRLQKIKNIEFYASGVDRVDNKKGYFKSNCVPCCTECNLMKGKSTYLKFKNKIKEIYSNLDLGVTH